MSQQEIRNDVTVLVRLTGITVPEARLAALAAGLTGTRAAAASITRYEFGVIEPACRFTPPSPR